MTGNAGQPLAVLSANFNRPDYHVIVTASLPAPAHALTRAFMMLGFDGLGDEVFRDLLAVGSLEPHIAAGRPQGSA